MTGCRIERGARSAGAFVPLPANRLDELWLERRGEAGFVADYLDRTVGRSITIRLPRGSFGSAQILPLIASINSRQM